MTPIDFFSVSNEGGDGTQIACDGSQGDAVHQTMNQAATDSFSEWLQRIQSEYFEMPGLHLSKRQAERFWNLDQRSCDVMFDALEASHFLRRTRANSYVRASVDY